MEKVRLGVVPETRVRTCAPLLGRMIMSSQKAASMPFGLPAPSPVLPKPMPAGVPGFEAWKTIAPLIPTDACVTALPMNAKANGSATTCEPSS